MTFQEAYKSGFPFRKSGDITFYTSFQGTLHRQGTVRGVSAEDLCVDDWEVDEPVVQFNERDVLRAVEVILKNPKATLEDFTNELKKVQGK